MLISILNTGSDHSLQDTASGRLLSLSRLAVIRWTGFYPGHLTRWSYRDFVNRVCLQPSRRFSSQREPRVAVSSSGKSGLYPSCSTGTTLPW